MKKFFLFIILIPFFSFSQNTNMVFGIDLNLDWYSLTDASKATYELSKLENKDAPYIMISFDHYNQIDPKFINLGFTEFLLGFPIIEVKDFNTFQPVIFISRLNYQDKFEYKSKSDIDVKKILSLLTEIYGKADLNMTKEEFSTYKWNGANYESILSCRLDDLNISFIYFKK